MFFAHGEHTPAQRAETFTAFAAADCAILANSRLIAEGVDIPSVDAIVFADPTRSVIRCVQALGRALRLDVSGKTASLIVPVYVPPGADGENILGTPYEPVWAIACALAGHDHRILERLPDKANRLPRETSDVIQRRWHFDFTVHPERIAQAMDLVSFDPRDQTVSRSRRLGLAAAQSYRDQYGTSTSRRPHRPHRLPAGHLHHHHARRPHRRPPRSRLDRRTRHPRHDLGQARRRLALPPRPPQPTTTTRTATSPPLPPPPSAPGSPSNATSPPRTPSMPPPRRRPHRTRCRLAPAPRRGLAPQIPPAPRPPRLRRRPGCPHPATPSWQG
ncbi:helicase-related protein [Streptomyces scabiei]|uniref:helicase-related protein n=1 Tax=Streptomyces scabiei TaxID=1930 RepID=UPI001FF083C8|nr:helicase-related protein [Streptomyces sp. LBUM 1475]